MKFKNIKNRISPPLNSLLLGMLVVILLGSCSKFLDEKPDKSITTIQNVQDLQAILDVNVGYNSLPTAAADEYYINESTFNGAAKEVRDTYTWIETVSNNWTSPYRNVYIANVVLEELKKMSENEQDFNRLKGQAHFKRAYAFFLVAQTYCRPYSETADTDPGIPLRLTPDIEVKPSRATVKETYEKIIQDLKEAVNLLPLDEVANNRPDKINTYGMLARVYLSMRDYASAKTYADLYLKEQNELMDYNTVDSTKDPSFKYDNIENSFWGQVTGILPNSRSFIDTSLYASYDTNDLRKVIFFKKNTDGTIRFKGNYSGAAGYLTFAGVATDEIYLIRAECNARMGFVDDALSDVNALLVKRWKKGQFVPRIASGKEEALQLVLSERRKELVFRGTRWSDLRRFNLEGANITLTRKVGPDTYTLPPNDKRWVWLIPREVIAAGDIEQNER